MYVVVVSTSVWKWICQYAQVETWYLITPNSRADNDNYILFETKKKWLSRIILSEKALHSNNWIVITWRETPVYLDECQHILLAHVLGIGKRKKVCFINHITFTKPQLTILDCANLWYIGMINAYVSFSRIF